MSCNFYLFLDGDSFPTEAWLDILAPLRVRRVERDRDEPRFDDEWICGTEKETVWVTLRKLTAANGSTSAPAWARWDIGIDFHARVFGEVYDANTVILLGLGWLPIHAPGVRVGAVDAQDPKLVLHETVDTWAENAVGWMPRETVDELVELVEQAGWALSRPRS